jgi:Fe2+ transport system protein FeoA
MNTSLKQNGSKQMSLSDIAMGKKAKIKSINAESQLKKRLRALGISKNSEIKVLEESIGKQNMKISMGTTEVALRKSEAEQIEVDEIK